MDETAQVDMGVGVSREDANDCVIPRTPHNTPVTLAGHTPTSHCRPPSPDLTLTELEAIWPEPTLESAVSPSLPADGALMEEGRGLVHEGPSSDQPARHLPPLPSPSPRIQGTRAELLVWADLIRQGFKAFSVPDYFPYDLGIDLDGRLIRVQVKSVLGVRKTKPHSYQFTLRSAQVYEPTDFDLYALIALDTGTIAYMKKDDRQIIHLKPSGSSGQKKQRNIDQYPLNLALEKVLA